MEFKNYTDSYVKPEKEIKKEWWNFWAVESYRAENVKKIEEQGKEVNIPNLSIEILKDVVGGYDLASSQSRAKQNPFIQITDEHKSLIGKVQDRANNFDRINSLSKKSSINLSLDEIKAITDYNDPKNQLTIKEQSTIKWLSRKQNELTEKNKRILETEPSNIFESLWKTLSDPYLRALDDDIDNDTILSRSLGAVHTAVTTVWTNLKEWSAELDFRSTSAHSGWVIEMYKDYMENLREVNNKYDLEIENIKKIDQWFFEKNLDFMQTEYERFVELSPMSNYVDTTFHHAGIWLKKMASSLTIEEDITFNSRMSRYMWWFVDTAMSPILALFDKEVWGRTSESAWVILSAAFEPIMATVSKIAQEMWSDRETADNWALVITAGLPFLAKWKNTGKVLTEEQKFFTELWDKEFQKQYTNFVDLSNKIKKIEVEFENKQYVWSEQIHSKASYNVNLKQAKNILKDPNLTKKDKLARLEEIYNDNKNKYFELKKEKKQITTFKIWNIFEVAAGKIWVINNLVKAEIVKDVNIKLSDHIVNNKVDVLVDSLQNKINNIFTEMDRVSQKREDGSYMSKTEYRQAKDQKKVDMVTDIIDTSWMHLVPEERVKMIENTIEIVNNKKWVIQEKARELYNYQQNKKIFDETAEIMWWDKKERIAAERDLNIKDTKELSTKYNWIKILESEWVIEFKKVDGFWNREYSIVEWMEWVFNWKKWEIFHYPEYLHKIKEMENRIKIIEKKAEVWCL